MRDVDTGRGNIRSLSTNCPKVYQSHGYLYRLLEIRGTNLHHQVHTCDVDSVCTSSEATSSKSLATEAVIPTATRSSSIAAWIASRDGCGSKQPSTTFVAESLCSAQLATATAATRHRALLESLPIPTALISAQTVPVKLPRSDTGLDLWIVATGAVCWRELDQRGSEPHARTKVHQLSPTIIN